MNHDRHELKEIPANLRLHVELHIRIHDITHGLHVKLVRMHLLDDEGEVEETVFRSKVVRNSLDPEFGQMFRICIPPHQLEAKQGRVSCYVQVWDWDRYDEDDHIGTATVELKANNSQKYSQHY